jgi:hypothetical protein
MEVYRVRIPAFRESEAKMRIPGEDERVLEY